MHILDQHPGVPGPCILKPGKLQWGALRGLQERPAGATIATPHRIPCYSSDFGGFVLDGSPVSRDGIDVRLEQQLHARGSYGRHLLPGGDPNLSMGLYETTWDSTPAAGAMGLFERRRRGRVAMCLGSSRRSSRVIKGPINKYNQRSAGELGRDG